ncbi:CD3337/EF1877 family mobilome membrane protein [Gemella morbillorum]|uniref:CD3337/EF1877 family mobilome membrane protein n=1 Tax=Gemella morbillorum TaxID=29391 RepID=UPI0028D03F2F|nr:hypothetical protein [Gemella morbillorum]
MTKKRKIVYVMISLLLFIFSTISIVYASSIDDKYNNLEQYQSYIYDEAKLLKTASLSNMIANFLFGIAKTIASITDFFLKMLYDSDALNSIVNLLGDTSSTIYNNIFGRYGVLLFLIGGTIAGVRYMMSAHRGVKDMLQLVLLIGICTLWVTNASPIISSANEFSNDVQSTIATSGDKLLGSDEKLDSKDILREKFFKQAVEQPFLLLNFNELDKEKVNSNSNFKSESGNRVDDLLKFRVSDDQDKHIKEYELNDKDYKGESNQNYWVSTYSGTHKLTVSFLSVIMNSILMLPFNVIAFFNFIIQIQIVFYILIVPFTLLASYLPFMRMSYVSVFKNLFGLYVIKAMLGLVILLVSLVMNLTRKIMESSNASPVTIYTTSTILLVVSLVAMWKNRKQILATLSAGGVGNIGMSTLNGMMKKPRFNGSIFNSGSSGENQDINKQENKAPEENLDSPQVRERYNYEEVERTPQEIQNNNQSNVSGNSLNNQPVLDEEQRIMNKDVINDSVRTPQTEYNQSLSNMTRGNNYNYDNYRTSQSDYVGSSDSLGSSSNDYVETRPLVEDSSLKYSDYTGQYSNINLTQDEYNKYLDKLGNDKERLHSIIDYASESKNNGLYQNQSDSRRLENIVNRAGQTKNFTSINKPVYSAPFPDYLKEQMKNISQTKSSSEREITEEDEQAYNSMLEELNKR